MGDVGPGTAYFGLVASAIPTAVAGAWVLIQWLAKRKDAAREAAQTQQARDAAEIQAEREKLSARTNVWIDWIQGDNRALRERIKEIEADRDRCERETDAYRRTLTDVRGLLREARAIADAETRVGGRPTKEWTQEPPDPR